MDQATIRRRLHALRERHDTSQAELAQAMGFKDRQTLSAIELGERAITPAEVVRAAAFFEVEPGYFTDPFELAGEATFSWRRTAQADDLDAFEQQAGRWIATYRHLSRLKGEPVNSSLTRVALGPKSSFEDAIVEGEAVCRSLGLGEFPSKTIAAVLEDKLDTLVLLIDSAAGISGAACQLGPLNAILINRRESAGRRAFDLGHELFHLLTWRDMAPAHVEVVGSEPSGRYKRIEQLADNFSAGLLMPAGTVANALEAEPLPKDPSALVKRIRDIARQLGVSGQALKWRLVALGYLAQAAADRLDDADLRADAAGDASLPPRFSRRFMEMLSWGIEQGQMSVRKAASVLGMTVDDLVALFAEHGLRPPFDL